ncbi:precorrin-2 dehydrogenase/sirohydrochlorin ferrochelatase family protein [Shouchella shacheensis]|uniref:precorrin-2 dehydrogenase/sirohydrochlorin ferrochelatase family protein n=1 Tax=Shouchella shacheensis TaxID=1649580 RepID=UPI00073FFC70|nr:NAD(P)-dependent oxidoreductase [Shouchella shacheensis]
MSALPFMLEMSGLRAVVVGGGSVAARRVQPLVEAGAEVFVVAPSLNEELQQLEREGRFAWQQRLAVPSESFLSELVFLCTNQPDLHVAINEGKAPRQLVYFCDDAQNGDFYIPARLNHGLLTVSISTAGASPSYTKRVKQEIEQIIPERAEEELAFLQQARAKVLQEDVAKTRKLALLKEMAAPDFLQHPHREALFEQKMVELRDPSR